MAITELSPIVDPAIAGIKPRYENFIGGAWVPPTTGEYSDNVSPATGEVFTQVPRSGAADIELAPTRRMPPRTRGGRPRRPSAPGCCTASQT